MIDFKFDEPYTLNRTWRERAWAAVRDTRIATFFTKVNVAALVKDALTAAAEQGKQFVPILCEDVSDTHPGIPGMQSSQCRGCKRRILINPNGGTNAAHMVVKLCPGCYGIAISTMAETRKPHWLDEDERLRPWAHSPWMTVENFRDWAPGNVSGPFRR